MGWVVIVRRERAGVGRQDEGVVGSGARSWQAIPGLVRWPQASPEQQAFEHVLVPPFGHAKHDLFCILFSELLS